MMAAEPNNRHEEIPIEPEGLILSPIHPDQLFQTNQSNHSPLPLPELPKNKNTSLKSEQTGSIQWKPK